MKTIALAALALLSTPALAQPAETCLTKTLTGKDIAPPMCFVAETLSQTGGACETFLIGGDVPHPHICEKVRLAPMPDRPQED